MPDFSSGNIIQHHFHVDNDIGKLGIGYGMIICRDLMVQLGLLDKFKRQVLQWDGVTTPMKEPSGLIRKPDLTSRKMREVAMQTAEPVSTRETTGRLVKPLKSNYAKADLKQVTGNETHLNADEITQLISLLKDFEDLIDGTIGYWNTEPVDL